MRALSLGFALLLVSCTKAPGPAAGEDRRPSGTASSAPSPSAPAPPPSSSAGAPGAGDRSGTSIANALALAKGAPATFKVPCSGAAYVGPFSFARDPERVQVIGQGKSENGEQICTGGAWVDQTGAFMGVTGVGCVEGTTAVDRTLDIEYSPGNGGMGANPVYLALKFDEPQPADCKTVQVTLRLP